MKTREQKEQLAKLAQDQIKQSKIVIFTDYSGMTVADMAGLRARLTENENKYQVIKNALIDIAAQKENYKTQIKKEKTQTAVVFGYSDEVLPAKALVEFIKQSEKPRIIGGLYNGEVISAEDVEKIASIPSRQQLEARLVGTIAGPITGMVNVLQGNIRGLVSILNQYKDKINK
jgi:large subunit ribosomal protein L10